MLQVSMLSKPEQSGEPCGKTLNERLTQRGMLATHSVFDEKAKRPSMNAKSQIRKRPVGSSESRTQERSRVGTSKIGIQDD